MNNFEKISGLIGNISKVSSPSEIFLDTTTGFGSIETKHWTYFRVNNVPCRMKGFGNIANGDQVTVVGKRNGELNVLALVNETTHLKYEVKVPSGIALYFWYFLSFIFIGLALLDIVYLSSLGLLFLLILATPFVYISVKANKARKDMDYAMQMLRN